MTTWFAQYPNDDPDNPDQLPHLVCPHCGCPQIHLVGHGFKTQAQDPNLMPHHEVTLEFSGACGHFWMIFLGDFGDETLLDVVAPQVPKRPRALRRTSIEKRWK